jgi:ABC-type Fe3+/spermidine/putrescine transport system ATPase subunit
VADFIGESNLISGSIEQTGEGPVFTSAKGLRVKLGGAAPAGTSHLVVRPEYVRVGTAAEACANRYRAEILELLYVGDLLKYRLVVDQRDEIVAKTLAPSTAQPWGAGRQLTVGWEPADCLTVNA